MAEITAVLGGVHVPQLPFSGIPEYIFSPNPPHEEHVWNDRIVEKYKSDGWFLLL